MARRVSHARRLTAQQSLQNLVLDNRLARRIANGHGPHDLSGGPSARVYQQAPRDDDAETPTVQRSA